MLSIRLSKSIETDIKTLASIMKINQSTLLREAIVSYMDDMKDYLLATECLKEMKELKKQGKKTTYTLEEAKEILKNEIQNRTIK